ncbi:hypothetical protein [Burkholderia cenocepacia]|uniref:hypothetical protein n=1 Tax=Burkholderia cenocepacia TaxID=95486 RepID=UPI002AB77645|nr:hypothetical protein [Burkholderia cenocepacia]
MHPIGERLGFDGLVGLNALPGKVLPTMKEGSERIAGDVRMSNAVWISLTQSHSKPAAFNG